VWKQSRYGKGGAERDPAEARRDALDPDDRDQEGGDEAYVNCPFDEASTAAFVRALVRRREGRGALVRGREVLRGLPAMSRSWRSAAS
jgi:folate-dependent tRNA-U54 methylase TrmFO/GidA